MRRGSPSLAPSSRAWPVSTAALALHLAPAPAMIGAAAEMWRHRMCRSLRLQPPVHQLSSLHSHARGSHGGRLAGSRVRGGRDATPTAAGMGAWAQPQAQAERHSQRSGHMTADGSMAGALSPFCSGHVRRVNMLRVLHGHPLGSLLRCDLCARPVKNVTVNR